MSIQKTETLYGEPIILGESWVGKKDYVRHLGGIDVSISGPDENFKGRTIRELFPEPEKDAGGRLLTADHESLGRTATILKEYFLDRTKPGLVAMSRVGITATFADFKKDSRPEALFMAAIQPGHRTPTLIKQPMIYDMEGNQNSRLGRPDSKRNPQELIESILADLAKYHLETRTEGHLEFLQGIQAGLAQEPRPQVDPKRSWLEKLRGR